MVRFIRAGETFSLVSESGRDLSALPRLTGKIASPVHPVGGGPARVTLRDVGGGSWPKGGVARSDDDDITSNKVVRYPQGRTLGYAPAILLRQLYPPMIPGRNVISPGKAAQIRRPMNCRIKNGNMPL